MLDPNIFYLSLASVSSVLLGICVTLRNNAFSTILRHYDEEIQLGEKDYEPILRRSAHGAMSAGILFALAILSSFAGLFFSPPGSLGIWEFRAAIGTFSGGLLSLVYALFTDHLKWPSWPFRTPKKPDRSERPKVKTGEDGGSGETEPEVETRKPPK